MYVRTKSAAVVLFLLVAVLAACLPAVASASEQPALTLSAAPASITYGGSADLTAQGAAPGASLTLFRKRASEADFVEVGVATAGADGTFRWAVKPTETTAFRVDQAAGESWAAAAAEATVNVRHRVTLAVAAAKPLIEGRYVRYTVSVRPAHAGDTAQLQQWTGGAWVALADVALGDDSSGKVRLLAGKPGSSSSAPRWRPTPRTSRATAVPGNASCTTVATPTACRRSTRTSSSSTSASTSSTTTSTAT